MKLILKERPLDNKIYQIQELMWTLEDTYKVSLIFDNTYPNHYKLIYNDVSFEFNTYSGVINALNLLINVKGGEE